MPKSIFLILLFIAVLSASAQSQDITGLWKGQLYNDSTQKYYSYEIGISEEKGKLSGFSHTWFILDDKQYFGVKKVKVKRAPDGKVIIEDDGLISHNYPISPAKGVKQLNILTLDASDSTMRLSGPFTTNRTKNYAPLTGTVSLERKNDFWQSALIPHLQELNITKLSFITEGPKATNIALVDRKAPGETVFDEKQQTGSSEMKIGTSRTEALDSSSVKLSTVNTVHEKKTFDTAKAAGGINEPIRTRVSMSEIAIISAGSKPAANVITRSTVLQQTVYFNTDSLQLSLYDNGEVDGDTVSVLMNGNVIMAREKLGTNAVRKTIFVEPGSDSVLLIMYAENLGAIAPNTGLLVIRDGKRIYEVRFSGDLEKNAAVMLRRKK